MRSDPLLPMLAIDPSDTRHAWAVLNAGDDGPYIAGHGRDLDTWPGDRDLPLESVVCEMVACYGMAAGAHLFDTCVAIGRLQARWPHLLRITRPEVKLAVCGQVRAKDANVRQAIIDRFGGPTATKKGGPLYKVAGDTWAAIAVGLAALTPGARFYVPAAERSAAEVS